MTMLLLSNPPGRNRRGQFVKGRRKTAKRRRTTARRASPVRRRRRGTTAANPPATRRRRRRVGATLGRAKGVALRELLPTTAAGVAGFTLTNWGTAQGVAMLPKDVTSRIPAAAGPLVKAAVAVALGMFARARFMPAMVRRYAPAFAAGGLINAGLDAWQMVRARALSGYSNPMPMAGYSNPMPLMGYDGYEDDGAVGNMYEYDVIDAA